MTPRRAKVHFVLLAIVLFACFFVGMNVAWDLSDRVYVVLKYGWDNVHKYDLHVTRAKPLIVVSNGDRADSATTFVVGLAGLVLGVTLLLLSLGLIARLTALFGRRINVFQAAAALSQLNIEPKKPKPDWADILMLVAPLALSVVTIHLIISDTLLHTLRNHAIFLAAAGVVLRLAFIGSPPIAEPTAQEGERPRITRERPR